MEVPNHLMLNVILRNRWCYHDRRLDTVSYRYGVFDDRAFYLRFLLFDVKLQTTGRFYAERY